jgi:hypothetical protein
MQNRKLQARNLPNHSRTLSSTRMPISPPPSSIERKTMPMTIGGRMAMLTRVTISTGRKNETAKRTNLARPIIAYAEAIAPGTASSRMSILQSFGSARTTA